MAFLLIPSFTPALGVMGRNPVGIPHAERLLAVAGVTWILSIGLAWCVARLGSGEIPAVVLSTAVTILFYTGGHVTNRFGYLLAGLFIVLFLALGLVLAVRLASESFLRAVAIGVGVALLAGPAIDFIDSLRSAGIDHVSDTTQLAVEMKQRPDIWLVVFDGHPGLGDIAIDIGPEVASTLRSDLEGAGFKTEPAVLASYWITDYSLPSIVNLGNPSSEPATNDASLRSLYEMISGDNRIVSLLETNGYETYMVESGWSGSSCGDQYDHCVVSPWFDEPMFFMLARSLIGNVLLRQRGFAFTEGAKSTMRWLEENAAKISEDQASTFVFAHVMAPHPPFFLDANCALTVTNARFGTTFQKSGVDVPERYDYLRQQMGCVDTFMVELSKKVGDSAVLILVSDHGTDSRDQLIRPPETWDEMARMERLNAFFAVKGGCPVGEGVTLPDMLRRSLSCLVAGGLEGSDVGVFLGPEDELSDSDVLSIVGLLEES